MPISDPNNLLPALRAAAAIPTGADRVVRDKAINLAWNDETVAAVFARAKLSRAIVKGPGVTTISASVAMEEIPDVIIYLARAAALDMNVKPTENDPYGLRWAFARALCPQEDVSARPDWNHSADLMVDVYDRIELVDVCEFAPICITILARAWWLIQKAESDRFQDAVDIDYELA